MENISMDILYGTNYCIRRGFRSNVLSCNPSVTSVVTYRLLAIVLGVKSKNKKEKKGKRKKEKFAHVSNTHIEKYIYVYKAKSD
jgi:hypothetical protein